MVNQKFSNTEEPTEVAGTQEDQDEQWQWVGQGDTNRGGGTALEFPSAGE